MIRYVLRSGVSFFRSLRGFRRGHVSPPWQKRSVRLSRSTAVERGLHAHCCKRYRARRTHTSTAARDTAHEGHIQVLLQEIKGTNGTNSKQVRVMPNVSVVAKDGDQTKCQELRVLCTLPRRVR